jgi:hypothetical protein
MGRLRTSPSRAASEFAGGEMDKPKFELKTVNYSEIHPFPYRQSRLSESQVGRVRLLRAALWSVYPHSMAFWVDGFERDAAPEPEICWWEHAAASYLEFEEVMKPEESSRGMLFWVMTNLLMGAKPDDLQVLKSVSNAHVVVETMLSILKSDRPIKDIDEPEFGWGGPTVKPDDDRRS